MKKLMLAVTSLMIGMTVGVFAQGVEINMDNFNNTNMSPFATSSGLIFGPGGGLLTGNISATLLGGATSNSAALTSIITLLSSTGQILSGNAIGSPGQFFDVSGAAYNVPGVAPGQTAFLDLEVWEGNFSSFQAALAGGGLVADSGIFANPTGGAGVPPSIPQDLVGMPAINFTPEPGTLTLCGLGAASLLFFRRRK